MGGGGDGSDGCVIMRFLNDTSYEQIGGIEGSYMDGPSLDNLKGNIDHIGNEISIFDFHGKN